MLYICTLACWHDVTRGNVSASLCILYNSTTGPDGYGSAGVPGAVGDKGEAGEPSRVEGSRGPPGQKGERGVPGSCSGERDLLIICFSSGCYRCHKMQYSVGSCIGELSRPSAPRILLMKLQLHKHDGFSFFLLQICQCLLFF